MFKKPKKVAYFFSTILIIISIFPSVILNLSLEKKVYEVDENVCKSDIQIFYSYITSKSEIQNSIYFLKKFDFNIESTISIDEYFNKIVYKSYTFFIPEKQTLNFPPRGPPTI
ncbi:MAG: hypothetical protein ACK4UJ_07975 [Leptonema sp. (in: bacteria)]